MWRGSGGDGGGDDKRRNEMLKRKNDRDRPEKEEGGEMQCGPFCVLLHCRGPNSFLSLCYALWPLSNLGFSLAHTHHQGHHGAHDSIYFCLALDAFIF